MVEILKKQKLQIENIVELFEKKVEESTENTAIIFNKEKITYRELNSRAEIIAKKLENEGVNKGDIVIIALEKSVNLIAGIIGVLKIGGTFLPIDIRIPQKRIDYIVKDSKTKFAIVDKTTDIKISCEKNIDLEKIDYSMDSEKMIKREIMGNDVAYIIYTSGTTGNPKGVMIEHKSLVNYILYAKENYFTEKNLIMPLYTSVSFDLTITSIFAPLVSNGIIRIYCEKDLSKLLQKIFIDDENNIIKTTPAHLRIVEEFKNINNLIKKIIIGGEELQINLAKKINKKANGDIELINEYGPTEATVGCITHKYDENIEYKKSVWIGKSITNINAYVVNEKMELCDKGESGELILGGIGVAKGYFNNDELTSEKFICGIEGISERVYRTGDLVRILKNGEFEYLGRNDNQIKIRGHRVDIGEIEHLIRNIEGVEDICIVVRDKKEKELEGYILSKEQDVLDRVIDKCKNYFPEYMIPKKLSILGNFPITENGKVDKELLPKMEFGCKENYEMPTNPLEEELVELWREMLDIDEIGINDNFLELGGHSLIATKMVYKINDLYEIDLSLVEFLTIGLTIKKLGKIIEEKLFDSISDDELEAMLNEIENEN